MPVIAPDASERKRKPSSTVLASPLSGVAGVFTGVQTLQGQLPGGGIATPVVNPEVKFAAMELPARSLTPLAPPITEMVYAVVDARPAFGCRVAVFELLL